MYTHLIYLIYNHFMYTHLMYLIYNHFMYTHLIYSFYIPFDTLKRISNCGNDVESAIHFVFHCPLCSNERAKY